MLLHKIVYLASFCDRYPRAHCYALLEILKITQIAQVTIGLIYPK